VKTNAVTAKAGAKNVLTIFVVSAPIECRRSRRKVPHQSFLTIVDRILWRLNAVPPNDRNNYVLQITVKDATSA
jgi:hypothetical protein